MLNVKRQFFKNVHLYLFFGQKTKNMSKKNNYYLIIKAILIKN